MEEEEDIQYNFSANGKNEILEILKATDVNTLTPIEAMQTLYDLKKKAEELYRKRGDMTVPDQYSSQRSIQPNCRR